MSTHFLPFALPDIGEEEISEVVESLRSGWVTTGPKTKQFESDFSAFIGANVEAIAVNSATAGLHLALEALGVGAGDEVITTTYTFTATAEVVRYLGAHPVFVDIDAQTLNIDTSKIEQAITSKTKVIIPVHFAGLACDMREILSIAKRHSLRVIEDAAHALPATYAGQRVGTLDSDATVYSFYATKTITTGEGGMVVTRHKSVSDRIKVMRLHGISRDAFDRYQSKKPSWHYEIVAPGYKYNLTDIASAIGIHQLKKAERFRQRREEIARLYDKNFEDLPLVLPAHEPEGEIHSWHLYVVRLEENTHIGRDNFIKQMSDKGVGCSVHFIPLHIHPYWRDSYKLEARAFPVALNAYKQAVSLPIYTKMTNDDVYKVIDAVKSVLKI